MRTHLSEMGPLVFLEQHNNFGFDLILFIFQNGVKGELGLGTTKNLKTLHAGPLQGPSRQEGSARRLRLPLSSITRRKRSPRIRRKTTTLVLVLVLRLPLRCC